jgi:hypothetical protein
MVLKEPKVTKEPRVIREPKELRVTKEPKGTVGFKDFRATRVLLGLQ